MSHFLFLFQGREGSSAVIDWLDRHPDVIVPFFESLDWYNEDIREYEPIHRLVDFVYVHGDLKAAQQSFAAPGCAGAARRDKSIGFKWRVWGDPERLAAVLARHRVRVFRLFRENLLEMAVSGYFSNVVVPRLESEEGIDLGGGGHFQFALAEMDEERQAHYLELRRQVRFHVPPQELEGIVAAISDTKMEIYRTYCRAMQSQGVPVFSLRYEDLAEDKERFFRAVCAELGVEFERQVPHEPYFRKATSAPLLSQVTNLEEIERLPFVRSASATIRDSIYKDHEYLFAARRGGAPSRI